jgi:hypothetical protein
MIMNHSLLVLVLQQIRHRAKLRTISNCSPITHSECQARSLEFIGKPLSQVMPKRVQPLESKIISWKDDVCKRSNFQKI